MMALTADDREVVRLIAGEVASQVGAELASRQSELVAGMIAQHAKTCELADTIRGSKKMLLGVVIGLTAASGTGGIVGAVIGKLLM